MQTCAYAVIGVNPAGLSAGRAICLCGFERATG